jgi:hypothetical protein
MVQVLHEFLGLVRVIPEIRLLRLEFEFAYSLLSFVIVKDTSSAHQRAAEDRSPVPWYIVVLT